ncbi:chymotrypsin inhibitor [Coccinella septempunctata]|uniref:chymotrypsin inhibitor n=1 Tax=Coccinella septempunctata TaxID=41139 RepID=UPI001D05C570|nr:chymotrypsin inhibitor [Coccinella septempunctata]XP_044758797.1 chymotrypsin inhibitor [Coccinella septempunctata]
MYLSIFFVVLIGFIGSSQQDPICGENEHYTCSSTCVSTCQNFQFANCAPQCERGCYCKPNYIRSEDGGKCIPVRDCWKKFRN